MQLKRIENVKGLSKCARSRTRQIFDFDGGHCLASLEKKYCGFRTESRDNIREHDFDIPCASSIDFPDDRNAAPMFI